MTQRGKNDIPPPMPHERDLEAAYENGLSEWSWSAQTLEFLQTQVVKHTGIVAGDVLELGCGPKSVFEIHPAKDAFNVVAIDVVKSILPESHGQIKYICGDFIHYQFEQNFDLILDAHALHFIPGKDLFIQALSNLFSHTKPGGWIAMEMAVKPGKFRLPMLWSWDPETYFLEKAGRFQRFVPDGRWVEDQLIRTGYHIKFFYYPRQLRFEIGAESVGADLLWAICQRPED